GIELQVHRIAAAARPASLRVCQPEEAGSVRRRLHRQRQEQPGADSQGPAASSSLWLGGQEYKASKDGKIAVPFSTTPGIQKVVLCSGDFCSLAEFYH